MEINLDKDEMVEYMRTMSMVNSIFSKYDFISNFDINELVVDCGSFIRTEILENEDLERFKRCVFLRALASPSLKPEDPYYIKSKLKNIDPQFIDKAISENK